jgi:hypothetical protein
VKDPGSAALWFSKRLLDGAASWPVARPVRAGEPLPGPNNPASRSVCQATFQPPRRMPSGCQPAPHSGKPQTAQAMAQSCARYRRADCQSAAGCQPAPHSSKPQTTLAFLRHCRRCRQADCQSAPHRFSDLLEVAQSRRGARRLERIVIHRFSNLLAMA